MKVTQFYLENYSTGWRKYERECSIFSWIVRKREGGKKGLIWTLESYVNWSLTSHPDHPVLSL